MFLANPTLTSHQQAISDRFCQEHPTACAIGVHKLGKHYVQYKNLGIASIGVFDNKPVSFGCLGYVIADDVEITFSKK